MFDLQSLLGGLLAKILLSVSHFSWLGLSSWWFIFASDARHKGDEKKAELFTLFALPSVLPALAMIALPFIARFFFATAWMPPIWPIVAWMLCFALGIAGALYWHRVWIPRMNFFAAKLTKKTQLERNRKTDVREISKFLPAEIGDYDPARYIDERKGLFIGLDEKKRPVYIDYEASRIQHMLLTGRTRSGKGVAAQIIIPQQIARGEFVVVLDPKVDNWMPHAFRDACVRSNAPYHFLDLRQSAPAQCNPFSGCDTEVLENMLVGGFSLTEKGEAADFYRLADRKAARQCAAWLASNPGATARDALAKLGGEWCDEEGLNAPAFHSYMSEMADLDAVNARSGGVDIASGEKTGGCLYVVGDMINPRIIRMQRLILLRLLFLAKNRKVIDTQPRTISVFADEFKVHISRPFMTSLGASAGWGLHTILAFQSLQDLADCPADLDKDMVRGAVMENCSIQLSYAIKDPDTALWLSTSTGTILVDDESRTVQKNVALTETIHNERRISQSERAFIDVNMYLNLPKSCGVLAMPGQLARFCYTSPPKTVRSEAAITPTPAILTDAPTSAAAAIDVSDPTSAAAAIDV
ncbi:MAG: type IV secretory system conjugative DNA transfer family protein [Thiomonas sp.]|uniref:type IV secretory system conjugative DNA transfer family protein n=1 Tax=Thiomonas sp. TaxID=2047785 RepID=UPI002A367CE2|nr:type IV secretory system conjugative DNA transfer family protein [Thiomonas sp.]MDY0331137.1 type IV secretory system conjugative DNA transfer family protein [Thiomonas sp.]